MARIVAATIVETASGEVVGTAEPKQAAVATRMNEDAIQMGVNLRMHISLNKNPV